MTRVEVDKLLGEARRARLKGLRDLARVADRAPIAPEDGSAGVAAMHMSYGQPDQAMESFVEQMADIGRVEDFRVVVRVHPALRKQLRRDIAEEERRNTTFLSSECFGDIWAEDAGDVRVDRSILAAHHPPAGFDTAGVLFEGRMRRIYPTKEVHLFKETPRQFPKILFPTLGASYIEERDTCRGMAAIAVSTGQPLQMAFACIEGGNALVGRHRDGRPYVIVGRDSVELTQQLLQAELKRDVDEAFVRLAISKDYGVAPGDVTFVEQPGDYHLDVKMAAVQPGEIVVNDALEVARLVEKWARDDRAKAKPQLSGTLSSAVRERRKGALLDWKEAGPDFERNMRTLHARARKEAKLEALAVRDLRRAGFTVHRMAAKFEQTHWTPPMNFANSEQGRGRDGNRFCIMLGGERRAERYALDRLREISGDNIARFYFLDRALTPMTLAAGGGICCRSKIEVDVR